MPTGAIKDFFLSTQWAIVTTSNVPESTSTGAGKLWDVWTRSKIDWVV